jgi:3-phosphoshikimate 1-carboxyvinyltransferase
MALKDPLPITPFTRPVRGEVVLPGSKSITNRALLLAALCDREVKLTGALFSDDTRIMAEALRRLGFDVLENERDGTISVAGRGGAIPAEGADLHVGLAGTAARFLTALCAAAPRGVYRIAGTVQMHQRPMKGLIDALRSLGAKIACREKEGFLPIEIHAQGLRGGAVAIDASESSQMLSALLMVAPLAEAEVVVALSKPVREPYVEMTMQMMQRFGVDVASCAAPGDPRIPVPRGRYALGQPSYPVEPDASAASYFMALPLACRGKLKLNGVNHDSLQGDIRFSDVLQEAGLSLTYDSGSLVAGFGSGIRRGVAQNFYEFSDTFLTFAAIAPLLEGPTRITGVGHTRRQETDRIAGMARELRKLGQDVLEEEDSLAIAPRPLKPGLTVETYGDHRFAMSFAILGCHDLLADGRPWLKIRDPGCCAKTFPNFFGVLETLRQNSVSDYAAR